MRRALLLAAVVAPILAGVGCKNVVTGRCDCTNDPGVTAALSAGPSAPTNPYPVVGVSSANATPTYVAPVTPMETPMTTPEKMPMPEKPKN